MGFNSSPNDAPAKCVASRLIAILWGGLAAASLLVGFYLSWRRLSNRTIGMVMGLGAGAYLSAIACELIPEVFEYGGKLVGILTVMGSLVAALPAFMEI